MNWFDVPLVDVIHRIFYLHEKKECIGTIHNASVLYNRYDDIWNNCLKVSCSLKKYLKKRSVVGILGYNCAEWLISDISCMINDYITVGIHCSWDKEKIEEIIRITNMKCLIVHSSFLPLLSSMNMNDYIELIITMDNTTDIDKSKFTFPCISWKEIISTNENNVKKYCDKWLNSPNAFVSNMNDSNEICTIMFTSGSTGKPKGVCISKKRWKRDILCFPFAGCDKPFTILSYMALAHGADRLLCWQMLKAGGRIAMIHSPEHQELMSAINIAKPTFFLGLSHFWSRVYNDYIQLLCNKTTEKLFAYIKSNTIPLLESDIIECFHSSPSLLNSFSELFDVKDDLLEDIRDNWFGGKLFTPVTGGAHTSENVLKWMTEVFAPKTTSGSEQGSRVQDAYGTTEFPGISVNGEINSEVKLKLIDVPEMNYFTTDKPFARGEILVRYKDSNLKVQYWNKNETEQEDGWYHTGDIGYLDTKHRDESDNPILHIIDRKQNLVEIYLNGDSIWVGVNRLEKRVYSLCNGVNQICLIADRNSPGLIAVVVPNKIGIDYTEENFITLFKEHGKTNNLEDYEIPLYVIIQKHQWTIENEFVTPSGKIRRGLVQKQYQQQMEQIYASLESSSKHITNKIDNNVDSKIEILNKLKQQLINSTKKSYITQDTSCKDFLNFRFSGLCEEDTNKLNKLLELLINDVKIIRNESATWTKESKQLVYNETEKVTKLVEELNNKVKIETNNLINNIKNNNYTTTKESIQEYIKLLSNRQCILTKQYHNLREIESLPHIRHKEVTERYGYNLKLLMKYAEQCSVRVPYQIWAAGWWKNPDSDYDPANMLTTPLGSAEVFCDISGERIEKDVTEIGKERYHCIDLSEINHSIDSHEQIKDLRITIRNKFKNEEKDSLMKIINTIDPNENKVWVKEKAHFWHLRTSIDQEDAITPAEFFTNACKSYSNRPAIGIPNPKVITDSLVPIHYSQFAEAANIKFSEHSGYLWLSYSEIFELSSIVAKYLLSLEGIQEGSHIGICGYNNIEWAICDFACALAGCISIGLHTTNNNELCSSIVNTGNIICILCTQNRLNEQNNDNQTSFCASTVLKTCPTVKYLSILDCSLDLISNKIKKNYNTVKLSSLVDIIAKPDKVKDILLPNPSSYDISGLATILFTSGSSGIPKGVMVSRKSFYNDISQRVFIEPLITTSYIPLSHSSDRMKMWEFIGNGGRVGFGYYGAINWLEHEREKKNSMIELTAKHSNNVEQIFAQISVLQPTALSCPPRIWTGLYSLYKNELEKSKNEEKTKNIIRDMFGSRIKFLITGGGPTPFEILEFFKELFIDLSFCDSYGATECGAICSNGYPIISKGISVRLGNVDSLNIIGDNENYKVGHIGEILVTSPNMSSGYFGAKEETKKNFIDGWYHTGDIGERIDFDKYKILGRISSAIHRNGKIIFPGALEALYETCNEILQICIHYEPTNDKLFAIIVPTNENITKQLLLEKITLFTNKKRINKYEIPTDIIIDNQWTKENGYLTDQLKISRKKIIKNHFNKF